MGNYAYRALSKAQYTAFLKGEDILARNAAANISMQKHLVRSQKNSQWISTSKCFFALLSKRKTGDVIINGTPIIRIDLDKAKELGAVYFDISTDKLQEKHEIVWTQAKNFAKASREILFDGFIPREACTLMIDAGEMAKKGNVDWEVLIHQYVKKEIKAKAPKIRILRERINRLVEKSTDSLSSYRKDRLYELYYILDKYSEGYSFKWWSVSI